MIKLGYHIANITLPFSTISIVVISDDIFMVCLYILVFQIVRSYIFQELIISFVVKDLELSLISHFLFCVSTFSPSTPPHSQVSRNSIFNICHQDSEDNPSIILIHTCPYSFSRFYASNKQIYL